MLSAFADAEKACTSGGLGGAAGSLFMVTRHTKTTRRPHNVYIEGFPNQAASYERLGIEVAAGIRSRPGYRRRRMSDKSGYSTNVHSKSITWSHSECNIQRVHTIMLLEGRIFAGEFSGLLMRLTFSGSSSTHPGGASTTRSALQLAI